MPILSMFYGIIVRMYNESGGRHKMPHLHAQYQDHKIVVNLDTFETIEGSFPKKQYHQLLAWMGIHQDELKANWTLLSDGEAAFKVDPLK